MTAASRTIDVRGIRVPGLMYGTAWKEDRTQSLVRAALGAGFRAIDTANQRKHYFEAAVGEALKAAFDAGELKREELFLQTKFTSKDGQDQRLPYDPKASIEVQVRQSFESSLQHLGVRQLDSYVLHGPSYRSGLAKEDWGVWRAMEQLHGEGKVRLLGASNVALDQLEALCADAEVAPAFVQNRCYASQGWDREVRAFCRRHAIVYQGFSLLTANQAVLRHQRALQLAADARATVQQLIFRFALAVGMLPLTGTTSPQHMAEDLASFDVPLAPSAVEEIEALAG